MTDTTAGEGVTDRFLSWLEHEIDEASMDIGAAHQEGGEATEAETERASCLGFVRERYLALAAQPSAGAQGEARSMSVCGKVVAVPVEPTQEMINEVENAFPRSSPWALRKIWDVMVAASPPFLGHDYNVTESATPAQPDTGDVAALREALEASLAALQRLHTDVEALMADSEGVYGLHGNGDPAPWDELREGGRFEDWIGTPLWTARNAWHDGQAALSKPNAPGAAEDGGA